MKNDTSKTTALEKDYARLRTNHETYDCAKQAGDEAGMDAAREEYKAFQAELAAKGKHYCMIFREYCDSKQRGNDCIDFSDAIWETDVEPLLREMRTNGIDRFSLSSTWSGAVDTAWLFQQNGCTLEGLIRINGKFKRFDEEQYEEAHAYLFKVN